MRRATLVLALTACLIGCAAQGPTPATVPTTTSVAPSTTTTSAKPEGTTPSTTTTTTSTPAEQEPPPTDDAPGAEQIGLTEEITITILDEDGNAVGGTP